MKRRLFNLAAVMSLMLCVVLLFFWWRSQMFKDFVTVSQNDQYFIDSSLGVLTVGWSSSEKAVVVPIGATAIGLRPMAPSVPQAYSQSWVFNWDSTQNDATEGWGHYDRYDYGLPIGNQPLIHRCFGIGFPYWLLCGACVVPSALMGVGRLQRSRAERRKGLCPTCGYDLRESPNRCPECGTPR